MYGNGARQFMQLCRGSMGGFETRPYTGDTVDFEPPR
jgi:hypothetical protein